MEKQVIYIRPNLDKPFWNFSEEGKESFFKINKNLDNTLIKSRTLSISDDKLTCTVTITFNTQEGYELWEVDWFKFKGQYDRRRHIYNITYGHDLKILHHTDTDTPVIILDSINGIYNPRR